MAAVGSLVAVLGIGLLKLLHGLREYRAMGYPTWYLKSRHPSGLTADGVSFL